MDFEAQENRRPTKEERDEKKRKARDLANFNLAAKAKADEAFRANFERLKAERLARAEKSERSS